MLVNLFDVHEGKVVPSQSVYLVPKLKLIKDEFKEDYMKVYTYIFFLTCPDATINPCALLDEAEKDALIQHELQPIRFSLDDEMITDAIEVCEKLYETPVLRTFRAAKKMLEKIGKFLDTEEITYGKEGNATEIRGLMKELNVYWENYNKFAAILKEEQSKVRGDRAIPFHQADQYKETKDYS